MVAGYKRCPNGHFYKDDLSQCPYCSGVGASNSTQAATAEFVGGGAAGGGATIPAGGGGMNDANKTQVMPGMGGTVPNSGAFTAAETVNMNNTPPPAASKTMIIDDPTDAGFGGGEVRSSRKLVGWLVSYTINEMGVDFKLFEGRNIIGRDLDCQISVNDGTVSGKHAVLLYREGGYFIQDSLSTSGTRVNGSDTGVVAVPLKDGDEIKVGKTVFKFRTSF